PKAQPAPDPSPKRVSIGGSGVQWSRSPRLTVSPKDLQGEARSVVGRVAIYKEKSELLKQKIKKAMKYPATVIVVAIVVTIILM
ncbi:hypothetical protein RFW50_04315, partial [Acinetobacter baumannii]|nr:hypothetical protein [Acinetobacter baumannii]